MEQGTAMDAEEVRLFDGRNPEIETKERSTETHPDEVILSDNRMVGLDTNDQSTETDAEEVELRSGCVSPIPSSLLSEPQGGVELMEMVKKDTEERIAREKEFAEQRIAQCIASEKASAEKRIAREKEIAEERLLCEKRLAEERIAYERKTAEEEVQKVHVKYDSQRMQDEELRRARVTQQREREERYRNEKREELYEWWFSEWRENKDDLRSRIEVGGALNEIVDHYKFVHQYLGGDGCTIVVETKNQSTETDAEEAELRSGDVSPASSSVISLLASRRQCSIYPSDSSEGSHSEFSDDEAGPPVLQSDSDTSSTKSTKNGSIGTARRSPVSRNLLEDALKKVETDAVMSEDVEGLRLHGDDSASIISLLSSLVRNVSRGASDQKGENIPCENLNGSDSVSSGGETKTSANSGEVLSSVMSSAFLRTMDKFSKMAEITSDAVMQLKQRPLPLNPRIRLSQKKRRSTPRQCSNPTQQLVREQGTTLQATMESLTLTQKRLDDAEIRQRESAEIVHKLEGNQQSVQRTQEQEGCHGAERKIPSSGPQTEEVNPSSSASCHKNAVETDSAPAKSKHMPSMNATGQSDEADATSRTAVIESRKDSAIQRNYDFCNEKFPVMRYEIDRKALDMDESDSAKRKNTEARKKKRRYSWTEGGASICWNCQKEGHIRRQCDVLGKNSAGTDSDQHMMGNKGSETEAAKQPQSSKSKPRGAMTHHSKIADGGPRSEAMAPSQEEPQTTYEPREGLIMTEVEIEGETILGVLDTGTEMTIMNEECARLLLKRHPITYMDLLAKDACGNDIDIIGCMVVSMKIGEQLYEDRIFLARKLRQALLLGTNFLEQADARLKYPERELYLRGKKVPTSTVKFGTDAALTINAVSAPLETKNYEESSSGDLELNASEGRKRSRRGIRKNKERIREQDAHQNRMEASDEDCTGIHAAEVILRPVTKSIRDLSKPDSKLGAEARKSVFEIAAELGTYPYLYPHQNENQSLALGTAEDCMKKDENTVKSSIGGRLPRNHVACIDSSKSSQSYQQSATESMGSHANRKNHALKVDDTSRSTKTQKSSSHSYGGGQSEKDSKFQELSNEGCKTYSRSRTYRKKPAYGTKFQGHTYEEWLQQRRLLSAEQAGPLNARQNSQNFHGQRREEPRYRHLQIR